jgi:hypothetical protein
MVRLCARLSLRIGFDPQGDDIVVAWEDRNRIEPHALSRLPLDAINRRCVDVSKSHVDEAWLKVAGYGVAIDPTTAAEPIVVKSELNGNHDGRLLMGPLDGREPGLVYQRLVQSLDENGLVYTTRPVIMGDRVVMAYEARRPYPSWFHGGQTNGPADPADLYTSGEIDLILRFAAQIGMEYGELDVLRDRPSGRIYVVDANPTPLRPLTMSPEHDEPVYEVMAAAFTEFLGRRQLSKAPASTR